ncbi:adenosylcobalamin-dependent ribonucleoside-triphosphate reductase [Anaerocolumna cellulosilytica]|uniref:Adenosylcobalamin-dependent ribonucleoside-triphosphate reductase n=1 Tax=Anaerocolumna cellulosilytica TaxID=433286 RepID=A0A6S6R3I6_9FIRM|nr:ribonucleoside-triphosphate reductase, adenosylcobalamin-dependent [Anaerocolumna cellulosilytica]MBB5195184.1 adenosylcobalamin-dependent ribonucleoside-triphosphate reductase [Anaerocolumna cellulosilytica]BCJ96656.1 adenosylcobalamin-dependent ribonucleoside-triphosphate reductase [Anaerocolumna cellulosilytica]
MSGFLLDSFLKKYKTAESPFSSIGEFVYLRTYSRYLEQDKRRENWFETVLRTVEYNISLGIEHKQKYGIPIELEKERIEAEQLFDNLFHLRTFTSGRTLYMGGSEIVKEYPLSNYNCCFTLIETTEDFVDVFYLLMLGCGVGVRIDKKLICKFPEVRQVSLEGRYDGNVRLLTTKESMEHTLLNINQDKAKAEIKVGDSKEGWCDALRIYFNLVTLKEYESIKSITIDYSFVRPEGERLKRFGGRASGYKSLKRMFEKINKVMTKPAEGSLTTLDILDIATIISENVVSGGVRRSAMMIICDEDDEEVIQAKRNIYKVVDGNWIEDEEISHRKMSNNSVLYQSRPTLERIQEILHSIRINGEPGFINGAEAVRRKKTFQGCNPCGEILLQSKQCCNLSTNNLLAFVKEDDTLDVKKLEAVIRLSARVTIRMTLAEVELPEWNKVMQEDRIVGISLTGMMDMINRTKMSYEELGDLLGRLKDIVHAEGEKYCKELKISKPDLMTTIKPEGTLSNLPGVSSGIHYAHAQYYIRRVRIAASDPLYKMLEEQGGYPIHNEVGQTDENCTIKVIEFPMKAPEGKTKYEIGAIEQLNLYKLSMVHWTDHNTSITVHVREGEWDEVAKWLYDNFDYAVGVTFLPLFEETYPLLPFECTTREDYEERIKALKPIDYELLAKYDSDEEQEIVDTDCESGVCPVR